MIKVKICGLNDEAGFDAAVEAGADWVGFNFFPGSPRVVTPARAASLAARARGGPARIGLFVEPEADDIARVLDAVPLDALQLYMPGPRAAELATRFATPLWRPVGVSTPADLPRTAEGLQALLIEAKPPAGATRPGGNATRFDWQVTAGWQAPCPWLLAGGLDPDNVAEAIRVSGAAAVDVSSGVERARGVKDPARIAAFVKAARGE